MKMKTIAGFVPHGGAVAKTIIEAIEYTEKARQIGGAVVAAAKVASSGSLDSVAAQAAAQAKGVVLNTGSRFALERADKQLSFFKDKAEVAKVSDLLAQTDLVQKALL